MLVLAAGMSAVFMLVVAAMHVGVKAEPAAEKRLYRFICAAGNSAIQLYPCFRKSILSAGSYTAADKYVHAECGEHSCESAVSLSVGVCDFFSDNLIVFNVVDFELRGVTEMLKDVSVFVCYCNFHDIFLSLIVISQE